MLKSLKYITSACLLSNAIFCGAAETARETMKSSPQALLAQALKETEDKESKATAIQPTIKTINSVMHDDPAVLAFMQLEANAAGSLARAIANVAMLQKLISIDDKLQKIVDVLSNQKNQ